MRARFGSGLLAIVLIGCTYDPISYMAELRQPLDRTLVVGPGDVLIRVDKSRSLENDEGKADIFGRRTNEGYAEVRFAGIEGDGTVVLFRNDYIIVTNENAESRLPFLFSSTTINRNTQEPGDYAQNAFSVRGVQKEDFHTLIPMDALVIRVPQGSRTFVFEGYTVSFETVEPNAVTYRLARNPLALGAQSSNMP